MMKKTARILAWSLAGLAILLGLAITFTIGWRPFVGPRARPLTGQRIAATPERLARGTYLVKHVAPCMECHSPHRWTEHDAPIEPNLLGAGQEIAMKGLPGRIVAPNLSSDPETGAGTWTDDQLVRAIREGIGHDGRTLFPIMPYQHFRHMSDEDLASIIVYLRSLTPVRNPLPKSNVPFPVKYLINGLPEPVERPVTADLSTPEKRGEYDVEVLGVCGDCHTTADAQGNQVPNMGFAGGTALPFGDRKVVYSANITPSVNGIPYYTEALFIETIRTGKVRSRQLDDMMPTAYFRNMTDQDLKDIFAYLKTLKPVDHYVDNSLPPTKCPRCGLVHGGGEKNHKGDS